MKFIEDLVIKGLVWFQTKSKVGFFIVMIVLMVAQVILTEGIAASFLPESPLTIKLGEYITFVLAAFTTVRLSEGGNNSP